MDGPQDRAKAAAAARSVEQCVRLGQRLALGTGTTASEAIRAIAARFPGAPFDCVASSRASEEEARSLGLSVRPLAADDRFDLMIDGADEVSPSLDLTKGGGGALFREKLLAHLSAELVVVVDASKLVRSLGERFPIPVEVVPFARPALVRELSADGYRVSLRPGPEGTPYRTDNGNEILDLLPPGPIADPRGTARAIREHVGVVETGLFCGLARRVFVGHPDGRVDEIVAPPSAPA
ncbi:MAG TPA: ribose-5-phosphate isomerase RpiA [Thermoplasmata archaeon]|nr:ribose-5-phosphate isomerase RpiA [Thermoplasmata archaeon]